MISIRSFIVTVITCLVVSAHAGATQIDPENGLDEARTLYRQGLFDQTITKLEEVIDELERLRDLEERRIELADAHFLLGMSYVALRDDVSARENFQKTATLDPERVLDPDVYAPKVIELYEEAWIASRRPRERAPAADGDRHRPPDGENHFSSGARVRANDAIVGRLVSVDERTMTIVTEGLDTITLARDDITHLEVSTGRKGHALWGALIGAGAGALIGLAEGGDDCIGDGCYTRGENVAYGALGSALVGSLVGALIRSDKWMTVPSTDIAFGVNVTRTRTNAWVTWSF